MAANRDLPAFFDHVHPRSRIPDRAELAIGTVIVVIVALADVRSAIGFSSFGILTYYGIANASALTLRGPERRWPLWIAAAGLTGCAVLAFTLPWEAVAAGAGVVTLGAQPCLRREGACSARPLLPLSLDCYAVYSGGLPCRRKNR